MTAILDAIDDALTAYADHLGSPWPGRVPDTDELLEALFGAEDGVGALTPEAVTELDRRAGAADLAMLRSCGCLSDERPYVEHDERTRLDWPLAEYRLPVWGYFIADTRELPSSPPWLAEEDAWLADRATREAATR